MAGLSGRNPDDLSLSYSVDLDARTGTARLRVDVPMPSGRGGFGPGPSLTYSSSGGNSEMRAGWSLSWLLAIDLYTEKRLPLWDGADGMQMGGDELAPWLDAANGWQPRGRDLATWSVAYYRMRRGATQVRVEKWVAGASGRLHYRTRDVRNTVAIYGARPNAVARIADPADESRTLTRLPEFQLDPHANAVWFDYAPETADGVDRAAPSEPLRDDGAQRYLKRIPYGNGSPLAIDDGLLGGALPARRGCAGVSKCFSSWGAERSGAADGDSGLRVASAPARDGQVNANFGSSLGRRGEAPVGTHRYEDPPQSRDEGECPESVPGSGSGRDIHVRRVA